MFLTIINLCPPQGLVKTDFAPHSHRYRRSRALNILHSYHGVIQTDNKPLVLVLPLLSGQVSGDRCFPPQCTFLVSFKNLHSGRIDFVVPRGASGVTPSPTRDVKQMRTALLPMGERSHSSQVCCNTSVVERWIPVLTCSRYRPCLLHLQKPLHLHYRHPWMCSALYFLQAKAVSSIDSARGVRRAQSGLFVTPEISTLTTSL